jgi:EmrB/QacA subfamily drug resistance transporter
MPTLTRRDAVQYPPGEDPRRWWSLIVITASVLIISLDNTVLNVAVPTILRDFHTTLPSLQWVITGYALTFASLLIVGGRIGDIFGHRRAFILGAMFFGVGSLLAAVSQSVPQLIVGEAVIEGIGAALMLPNTLALLSTSFVGHERATAFGVWGAVGGAGAALGPVVGGVLTSNLSWRWSFGINVVIVPFAILGALAYMPKGPAERKRTSLDLPGAALGAAGMFLFIFAMSKGAQFGWLRSLRSFTVGGATVWPASWSISVVPVMWLLVVLVFFVFYLRERSLEARSARPLFEFGQLRHRGFSNGLALSVVATVGQTSLSFILPIFLQDGRGLSAQTNGVWQLPIGLFVLVGSQIGSRLARRVDLAVIVRWGMIIGFASLLYIGASLSVTMSFLQLMPGLVAFGLGFGISMSQVSNIVLSDVDQNKAGVAGGANATSRQIGVSIGIAITGALLASRTIATATHSVNASGALSSSAKASAVTALRRGGVSFSVPQGTSGADSSLLHHLFREALTGASKAAFVAAAVAVGISFVIALRLPRNLGAHAADRDEVLIDAGV